ncbi:MAG: hypothetical protein ABI770_08770 [Sphingomicrobium sp.]
MDELLSDGFGWRDALDVARAALVEWVLHCRKIGVETMRTYPGNIAVLVRKPSAIAPIVMSLLALAIVLIAITTSGASQLRRATDEGTAAHIWQLLMAGQIPFLGWFALHWLRRDFRAGLPILGLQIGAFVAAFLPVWLLGL